MSDGSRYLTSTGQKLLDATGDTVLRDPTIQPCCCPDIECPAPESPCNCNNIATVMCCISTEATFSVTFPTITAASGVGSQPFGATALAFIAAASGNTLALNPPVVTIPATNDVYWLEGDVAEIDCCYSYTWRVEVEVDADAPYMAYSMEVFVVRTNKGDRVVDTDPFPCRGESFVGNVIFASTGTAAEGDCCGPTEYIVLDNIDADYIDDATLTITGGTFSEPCSICAWADAPATASIDMRDFYPSIPADIAIATVTLVSFNPPVGLTGDNAYEGDTGGTFIVSGDGLWRVQWEAKLEDRVASVAGPTDCPNQCCWGFEWFGTIQEFVDPDWITRFQPGSGRWILCPRVSVTGTYTVYENPGGAYPATLEVV